MTVLDILILSFLGYFIIHGGRKGFVRLFFDALALLLGVGIAIQFNGAASSFLLSIFSLPNDVVFALSFILIWLGVFCFFSLMSKVFNRFISGSLLGPLNFVLGCVFGGVKGCVFLTPILVGLLYFQLPYVEKSTVVSIVRPGLNWILHDFFEKGE